MTCSYCIKTLTPGLGRKNQVRSGFESRLRGPVSLENCRRVTSYTIRLTKLIHHVCLPLGFNSTTGNGFYKSWLPTSMYWGSRVFDLRHNNRFGYVVQRSKYDLSGILGTLGNPKGRKSYGGGGLVRSLGTKRFFSTPTINTSVRGGLKGLIKDNKVILVWC